MITRKGKIAAGALAAAALVGAAVAVQPTKPTAPEIHQFIVHNPDVKAILYHTGDPTATIEFYSTSTTLTIPMTGGWANVQAIDSKIDSLKP